MPATPRTTTTFGHLRTAKKAKQDEFYTQLADIEREVRHYKKHFKGKVVYLNCDDPRVSGFFHFFSYNFEKFGLKRLIATCYRSATADEFSSNNSEQAVYLEYDGDKNGSMVPDLDEIGIKPLMGDGDFRSEESITLLRQADIVVTNQPFSLFRQYIGQLIEHDKEFLIVGNQNAISYKEIFPLIQQNKVWLGNHSGDMKFKVPDHYEARATRFWVDEDGQKWRSMGNACWFTNMDYRKRHEDLILYKTYDPALYPTYDNYDAIDVSRTVDIPVDYDGVMGVPLTFLNKHNPDQFEIVGIAKAPMGEPSKMYPPQVQVNSNGERSTVTKLNDGPALKVDTLLPGKTYYEVEGEFYEQLYARILIKNKAVS